MNLQFLFLSISFYFFPTRDRKTIYLQPLFIRNTFASRNLKERKDVPPCEVRTSIFFTMTKIKILENEMSDSVRTMTDERGESSFAGKDVAKALGYTLTDKTIRRHVDKDDRMFRTVTDSKSRSPRAFVVNESGLYALILSSKLKEAKAFKWWVASEVLPQIRTTKGLIIIKH